MKDMLYAGIGLIGAIVGIWQLVAFLNQGKIVDTYRPLIIAIVCILVAIICFGLFLSGRVNKEEQIHVTE